MNFRVFGIPVTLRSSFFIMTVLLAYSRLSVPLLLVEWIAVVGVAVLIHELGHALAFRAFGHAPTIELHGMGGVTRSTDGKPLAPWQDAIVTFAGPGAGFALALIVYVISKLVDVPPQPDVRGMLVADTLWVSAGWGVLNLLPILPLDGGLLMATALRARFGPRSREVAYMISLVMALAAAGAAYLANWTYPMYMALWFAAGNGQSIFRAREGRRESARHDALSDSYAALQKGDWARADQLAKGLHATTKDDEVREKARLVACVARLKSGDATGAWEAIEPVPTAAMDPALLTAIENALFESGDFARAEAAFARRFDHTKDPKAAYNAGCACARQNRIDDALAWLGRAIDAGYRDPALYERDDDLVAVRASPGWDALRLKLRQAITPA